ncbi:MAG: hypothetical protein ACREOF_18185 [Gemmatimonadales bacterium]
MTMSGMDPFASESGGSSVRDEVRSIKDQAIERGRTSLRDARNRAASSLDEGKGRVAEQIGAVASAFRQAGEQLRAREQGRRIAGLTDAMGRQAEQAADYLRHADGRMLQHDVESLTRRQPALVLGGAFVAGLIGARFLRSSQRRRHDDFDPVYRTPGATLPAAYPPELGAPIGGADAGS